MKPLRLSTTVLGFRRRRWCRRSKRKNRKQEQQRSETSMKDLPPDVYVKILKQLPITSLLYFKLVSKACYAMATNPLLAGNCLVINPLKTIHEHLIPHQYPIHVIENGKVVRTIEMPSIEGCDHHSGPVLSSNGLLCLCLHSLHGYCNEYKMFISHRGPEVYHVCLLNPLMGKPNFLPDPDMPEFHKSCNQKIERESYYFGFGYNASTGAYKVIRIASSYERLTDGRYGSVLQAKVITVGGKRCGQWSEIGEPFLCPLHSSDVVVGDAIHWEGMKKGRARAILSFDLSEEKFHQVSYPDAEDVSVYDSYLSVLGGCLALTRNYNDSEVHLWTMKEYGVKESWTKEFVIRSTKFSRSCGYCGIIRPQFRLEGGRILILYGRGAPFSYDTKKILFEKLGHHYENEGIIDQGYLTVILYKE